MLELLDYCFVAIFIFGFISWTFFEDVRYTIFFGLILITLCGIINWFGSKDPNSFFVRKQLLVICDAEIKEMGKNDYSKGFVVGKGNFFSDNDLLCLEISFTDASGAEQKIPYFDQQYLTFGETRQIYNNENYEKQYLIRLPQEKTNKFLSKYNKIKNAEKIEALEKIEKIYQERYESYIFKEEYSDSDYDW
jgi:hypothetical protein